MAASTVVATHLNQLLGERPQMLLGPDEVRAIIDGVRVVGVNFDGLQGAELARVSEAMGIRFSVLATDPAPRLKLPTSAALPVTYIVDAEGEVRERLVGEQTAAGLDSRLKALRGGS